MCNKKQHCYCLVVIFIFTNDFADFLTDWLFFTDVALMKPGLVYGPPGDTVWVMIFTLSIIGTFLFVMETVNLFYEATHENSWIDSDFLSMGVVWIEDIPQVAISLYLVLCREEALSIFQLVKAGVVLFGTAIRLIQVLFKLFHPKKVVHSISINMNRVDEFVRVAIFVGTVLQTAGSIAVFVLSYTSESDSKISLQVPSTLIEEKFDDRKYFENVSLFVNHKEYFDFGDSLSKGARVVNWMRLDSIDSIMAQGKRGNDIHFNLEYEAVLSSGAHKLAWWKSHKKSGTTGGQSTEPWVISACYVMHWNKSVSKISNPSNCARSSGFFTEDSNNIYISLHYTPPGFFFKGQVFGDITFNMRIQDGGKPSKPCRNVNSHKSSNPLRLHYFRTNPHLPPQGTAHLLTDGIHADSRRFFRNDQSDLTDIEDVWVTGWMGCASSGNLAPTLDKDLDLSCSRSN
ncbi:hypothetical protein EGW08_000287 [Elysia chlorotica]|uniref:Uncharacterized protein n=1 Tax=Elysia chlorotica TaxID=188477 RepID=A0A433UDI3_ELYCH|nr:hypothetical protein EGW08_000287 [Elysia chlorotica]